MKTRRRAEDTPADTMTKNLKGGTMASAVIAGIMLAVMVLFVPGISAAEFNTISELEAALGDRTCRTCHEKIYDEWQKSLHAQSVVHSLGGMRNFIAFGLERDWNQPVNRENLMRCMHCHAPALEHASESLIREIGSLILSAADGKEEAKKELSRLNVSCTVCHNMKAVVEVNLQGAPKQGVYYGPSGKPSTAHKTERSTVFSASVFCGQCHWLYTPPDGDTLYCNTLYGSYQDAYLATGRSETCQDCHMKVQGRGHMFPGAYDPAMVKEGIGLDLQVAAGRFQPGKGVPTAVVTIGLTNHAGHRIPDG
jgi:hypothetical protein